MNRECARFARSIFVGEMSDSSFEDSVVYALTVSHLTLDLKCLYGPTRYEKSLLAAIKSCLAFDHKLGLGP